MLCMKGLLFPYCCIVNRYPTNISSNIVLQICASLQRCLHDAPSKLRWVSNRPLHDCLPRWTKIPMRNGWTHKGRNSSLVWSSPFSTFLQTLQATSKASHFYISYLSRISKLFTRRFLLGNNSTTLSNCQSTRNIRNLLYKEKFLLAFYTQQQYQQQRQDLSSTSLHHNTGDHHGCSSKLFSSYGNTLFSRTPNAKCHLHTIAPELKDTILRCLLVAPGSIYGNIKTRYELENDLMYPHDSLDALAIARTCKQLHYEVLPIYYDCNSFNFADVNCRKSPALSYYTLSNSLIQWKSSSKLLAHLGGSSLRIYRSSSRIYSTTMARATARTQWYYCGSARLSDHWL